MAATEPSKAKLYAYFSDLYRAHLKDVYSYSYYRVGNHHDAEDLTEQTFLQAYRHFERAQKESEGRPLRPWLIRIAHNLARILRVVGQLSDDRREALIMRFALGMDNREIARALGRTDGATKVLLHRAIRQLEGMVAENAGHVDGTG